MTYASTSIDRRADYYARAAAVIAADPLDFYTRAERGRRFQTDQFSSQEVLPPRSGPVYAAPLAWRTETRVESRYVSDGERVSCGGALAA